MKLPSSRCWSHYFNISFLQNVECNPPFHFLSNGLIQHKPTLSVKYYDSLVHPNSIDTETDIVVLCNYNNQKRGTYSYSPLYDLSQYTKPLSITFQSSIQIIQLVDYLLKHVIIQPFYFIHIRRTDYLDNTILAPPYGTRPYTSTTHVAKCVKMVENKMNNRTTTPMNAEHNTTPITSKTIIVSTDEKSKEYKKELVDELKAFRIIYQESFIQQFPEMFLNDNYYTYQVMNEIAKKCQVNIGTIGYCRLGNACDFLLSQMS